MAGEEGSTRDDVLGGRLKLIASKVDSKIFFHKDAVMEYMDFKQLIGDLAVEKARMQEEAYRGMVAAPPDPELLAPVLEQLAAARAELAATKVELAAAKVEIDEKDEQLKAATLKLQEMEAMRNEEERQSASEAALDSVQTRGRQDPMQGQDVTLHGVEGNPSSKAQQFSEKIGGHHARSNNDLELLRETLLKEFMQLDCGGRILGVKEMGRLNRKRFHDACAVKLPLKEAEKKASTLCTKWEKLLKNPSWNTFKTVAVGDDSQEEVIDLDDDMLQELKRTWGEDAHDAVVCALMEMREYNCLSNRRITYELWNYKAGRKATTMECVEYLGSQVKQLSVAKRRKSRRTAGIA